MSAPTRWVLRFRQPTDPHPGELAGSGAVPYDVRLAATHLAPALVDLRLDQTVTGWWFTRTGLSWRLRLHPGPDTNPDTALATAASVLDRLRADGILDHLARSVTPDTTDTVTHCGGAAAHHAARHLWMLDSEHVLRHLTDPRPVIGTRDLSLLLCTILIDTARCRGVTRAQVWGRVTRLRPVVVDDPAIAPIAALPGALRYLLDAETHAGSPLFAPDGPLGHHRHWAAGVARTGDLLRRTHITGSLTRELPDLLAEHITAHWDRLGVSVIAQGLLAHAALRTASDTVGDTSPLT